MKETTSCGSMGNRDDIYTFHIVAGNKLYCLSLPGKASVIIYL